ncbi:MAG: caspase family protein [Bacteroidetes bacterium]|nr:caspase family protein [Bacteroidota bacterium]
MKKFLQAFVAIIFLLFFQNSFLFSQPNLIVPVGHTGIVFSIAYSPDGKFVLTGSQDGRAKLWDASSGKELITYNGHTNSVTSVAFSKDGKFVVTGSWDKTAKIWDMASGKELKTFIGHTDWITAVAISPDGKNILTGSYDKTIRLWDVQTGKKIRQYKGNEGRITSVNFSPDGTFFVCSCQDKLAKIYDVKKTKPLKTLIGHTDWVNSAVYSPDGKTILTGSGDKTAKLWDFASGKVLKSFAGHTSWINSVSFSRDGKYFASASYDKTVRVWNVAEGNEIKILKKHSAWVNSVAFSPVSDLLASAGSDKSAYLWDFNSSNPKEDFIGHSGAITSASYSKDGNFILLGSIDKTVKLIDISTGKDVRCFLGHTGAVNSVVLSKDGNTIFSGSADSTAKVWDAANVKEIKSFLGHTGAINSLAISPDEKLLITGSSDKTAKIWNIETGKEIFTLRGHTAWIKSVCFSPDGKTALTAGWDGLTKSWDVSTGKEIRTYSTSSSFVEAVAFSPNGLIIATGLANGTIKLWDTNTGKELKTLQKHNLSVTSICFSNDGKYLLSGSWDNTTKMWDIEGGNELKAFRGHTSWVNSVAFSPDDKYILTGSKDATTRIWTVSNAKELASFICLDNSDWVVTSSGGLFDASPEAMKLLYYLSGFETVELQQLKERYYEPSLLQKLLGFKEEKLRSVENFADVKLYPEVKLSATENNSDQININLLNQGGGIGKVVVFINGKEIASDARGDKPDENAKEVNLKVNVKNHPYLKSDGNNTIEVKAYNSEGYLVSRGVQMVITADDPSLKADPRIFIICVGVSDYSGDKIDLKYAAKDAEDIANALGLVGKRLFGEKNTFLTKMTSNQTDEKLKPSKVNIIKKFEEIAKEAKSTDVIAVYLSGHGINWGGQDGDFFYLTQEAYSASADGYGDPAIRKSSAISSTELTELIKKVPALKEVLMIDACASGKLVENLMSKRDISSSTVRALDRMKDRTGMYIITGCAADAVSYEASRYGQGLLTYCLLAGIKGESLREGKFVDVANLFNKAKERVPELAAGIGGIQKPQTFAPYGSESFDIGELTAEENAKIPLAMAKPLFLSTSLQESESFDDVLNLDALVDDEFSMHSSKGAKAPIVFLETKDYPDAYRLRGRYEINKKNEIIVKMNLFKGKEKINSFIVNGTKSDLKKLAEDITKKAEEFGK